MPASVRRSVHLSLPRALAVGAIGFALLAAGCREPAPAEAPRHVFLITVDTLRADHLPTYGYPRATGPAAARLAASGVTFDRAFCQWPKTGPSFASMFTSLYPQTTGLTHKAAIRIPEGLPTLAEHLAAAGFTTLAVNSNAVLGRQLGWDRGFREYVQAWGDDEEMSDDPLDYRRRTHAGRINELALPLIERHKDDARLFAWIHYSDPHAPYFLPDGMANPFVGDPWYTQTEAVTLEDERGTALGGERELRYYVAQYDANVLYADGKIVELLDRLDRLGLLDDALVIYTADHGEALGEHGYYFGHGRLPHNPGARVPLIVSWPRGALPRGTRVAAPVELVDLFPTLAELATPEHPVRGLDGRSLLPFLRPESPGAAAARALFLHAFTQAGGGPKNTHFRAVQDVRWKFVHHPAGAAGGHTLPPSWELYDLAADPGERANLVTPGLGDAPPTVAPSADPELRRLRKVLTDWMKGGDWIRLSRAQQEAQSKETLKALRALGYLE